MTTTSGASPTSFTPYPYETRDGTVTSFIPITTAWIPPGSQQGSCSSSYTWLHGDNFIIYDPNVAISAGGDADLTCWPPGATLWWQQNVLGPALTAATTGVLGPVTCPIAYETIGTSVRGSSTFVACCPSSYSVKSTAFVRNWDQCYSIVKSGASVSYYTQSPGSDNILSWTTAESVLNTEWTVYGLPFNGWNIAIATDAATNSSLSQNAAQRDNGGGGLSSGAKAGIGVGVALGTLGLLALIGALIIMMKARKQQKTDGSHPPVRMHPSPANGALDTSWRSSQPYLPVPPNPRQEVDGSRSPVEVQ